jgi:N-acetylneuraminate synthase
MMVVRRTIRIGSTLVGDSAPAYICAEIGINHNGSLQLVEELVDAACRAGCNAVKFQKRTPDQCVPPSERSQLRETPWGTMTYLEYRRRLEFGRAEYDHIAKYCLRKGIDWFVSVWDEGAVNFMESYGPIAYKIPSACLTDLTLLRRVAGTGRPVILSTGMSTMQQIREGVSAVGGGELLITHCTSAYPCQEDELNLRVIETLRRDFPAVPIGYSGHEVGLVPTIVARVSGACYLERHVTMSRAMWGSDQAASVEPAGLERLVRYVRSAERSLGDGIKRVYQSEVPLIKRLRRVVSDLPDSCAPTTFPRRSSSRPE